MIAEREIAVHSLQPGMYVGRLDRPWEDTDFPLQGFIVQGEREIAALARYCKTVFIDVELSEPKVRGQLLALPPCRPAAADSGPARVAPPYPQGEAAFQQAFTADVAALAPVRENFTARAADVLDALRSGAPMAQARVDSIVSPVIAAVMRNQDAWFWLMALKQH